MMTQIELVRVPGERRLFELAGVGTLRLGGIASRAALATAGGDTWRIGRPRFWSRAIEAVDVEGTAAGSFKPRVSRRGGTLHWTGREFALRPTSRWRQRYALASVANEVAIFEGKGWGTRPVMVHLNEPAIVESGLLLFAAFIVRGLAADAAA